MKKLVLINLSLAIIILFFLTGFLCLAQENPRDSLNKTQDVIQLPATDLPTYLGQIIGAALALTGSIFLILIIYGGFIIMTAAGNSEKADKGKRIIYWAIIGVLVIGASYGITTLVFKAISSSK